MLKSLDILIGLVVVLLALSMAVTVITQSLTTLFNSRGRHLKRGLEDLLQQLDPKLSATISATIADKVLTHPLVSGSHTPMSWFGSRYGNVIHREEFTKLLIALAGGGGSETLDDDTRNVLKAALARNGVADPEKTLADVRGFAMALEKTTPALANTARQNLAFLHAAPSDLVAKINSWFDQTMDRTSQRFTASTRALTFAGAFLVAFGLQVDTPSLANRLAMDDTMRNAFVQQAKEMTPPPAAGQPTAADVEVKYRSFLAENGVIHLPSGENYWAGFTPSGALGMLVTALLLSLGAPFWYNVLSRLLQLRSVLAFKDDKQRAERQTDTSTTGAAGPGAPASTTPDILAGERGNLAAVG